MKRLISSVLLLAVFVTGALAQSNPPLTIQEADGSPKKTNATKFVFPNGSLTVSGGTVTYTPAASGDVAGPASSTDNAVVRFDGATGKLLQDSVIFVSDGGMIQIGGTSASFPALKASGAVMQVRAGDDSGYATIQAQNFAAITNLQMVNSTSQLVGGVAGSYDVGMVRFAAGVWRVTDSGNGIGGVLIGTSAATGAVGALTVVGAAGTAYVNGAALSGSSTTSNFFNVTGTMPVTLSAVGYAVNFQVTSAGSSSQNNAALNVDYIAGYTGSATTDGIRTINASASTNTGFGAGNRGSTGAVNGTTAGNNLAVTGIALNGNLSIGGHFQATTNKNSATNVGVAGFGLNGGTTPVQVGGYFALTAAYPTFVSGALVANNGTQTDPIFRAQDNGSDSFVVLDGGRIYGTALHNNATALTGTGNQYIGSGTYTPTLTNTTNVAASTAYACQWIRVGNVVTVSGKFDLDATAAGATELDISLPIASALTAEEQLGGVATTQVAATPSGRIDADAANDWARVRFTATSISADSYSFTFTYVVL